jgi:internalin A
MKASLLLFLPLIASAAGTSWIESAGGTVSLNPRGQVIAVNLRASWVTDSDLARLAQFPQLTALDLSLTRITDQGMQELKNLPNVEELNLRFAEYVTDEGISAIKNWPKLKRLVLHGTKSSDTALDHIDGIKTLESLDAGSIMLTDVGLERLAALPHLKELTIGGNELGDAGLQALRQMPALTFLDLNGRQGTDSNVWTISMSDLGLDAILTLTKLQELRFGCTSIGVGIEGARFATVNMMSVTPRWLEKLKGLKDLKRLQLQGCDKIDDSAAQILAAFPALEHLDLKGASITEKGLTHLRAAKPKLHILHGPWQARAANFRNN